MPNTLTPVAVDFTSERMRVRRWRIAAEGTAMGVFRLGFVRPGTSLMPRLIVMNAIWPACARKNDFTRTSWVPGPQPGPLITDRVEAPKQAKFFNCRPGM